MQNEAKTNPAPSGNGWVSCGIPANSAEYGSFWTLWASSKDSRKCPCGELVITGPCPACGREYLPEKQH